METGASHDTGTEQTVCAFWLGDRCYGLPITLVGEILTIDRVAPVPLSPPSVLGVFSLRGAPTALVDLAQVLRLPEGRADSRSRTIVVLRGENETLCGAPIQRVEAVMAAPRDQITPATTENESPAVAGFLGAPGRVVTLLDPRVLVERLAALRYLKGGEE